jgi:hypothetical protein
VGGTALMLGLIASAAAVADIGPPAHLQISEREPGVFAVRWRVPDVLPGRAVPTPLLPASCAPDGAVDVTRQAGAWLFSQVWRCSGTLAGEEVGLRFPFPDLTLTTVARVELLSGDRFARLLTPGDPPWRLPQGTVLPDPLRAGRDAVMAGAAHALASPAHLALVLAAALLGRVSRPLHLLAAFTGAQVAGLLAAFLATPVDAPLGEAALGLAAALLAREALRPEAERTRLTTLALVGGAVHGAALPRMLDGALPEGHAGWAAPLVAILGMDAVQVVATAAVLALLAASAARRPVAHAAGAIGAAAALAAALNGGVALSGGEARAAAFESPAAQVAAAVPASQRLAPAGPAAPLQSFLTIEPFELRHEVMVQLADLAAVLDLQADGTLAVEAQPDVTGRLGALVLEHTALEVDGATLEPALRRVDFMTVDDTGALPRATPLREPVGEAIVGVVVVYPTQGIPERVTLAWQTFAGGPEAVPVTVIDPESVRTDVLLPDRPSVEWTNELIDDPIPTITVVAVEPARIPVPWLSLPLVMLAVLALVRSVRGERSGAGPSGDEISAASVGKEGGETTPSVRRPSREACSVAPPSDELASAARRARAAALVRVAFALALLVGPLVTTAVAIPGSRGTTPTEPQARRLLAGLLPNVYRALEFRDEARIYDRLAITVTGDTLTEIYLQQRRALELEERGGAQARVEAVEVIEAREIVSQPDGFTVRGTWVVGGMVTHFGHRHFRQNRYEARVGIAALDGSWKIRTIEVLEQERVQ